MLDKLKQKMEEVRDAAQAASASLLSQKVDPEIQLMRYNICQECPHLYKPTDTCKKCGCFMKVKTWMPKQSCPIKKWIAVE